mmetsp:Transcript_57595/g.168713  ORF Transcript_57595/g.168713 Transcript_57595/m.168713 type:complete len:338 (+) Transcript_57595:39-1052(+)
MGCDSGLGAQGAVDPPELGVGDNFACDKVHFHSDRGLADSVTWSTELLNQDFPIQHIDYLGDQARFLECVQSCTPAMISGIMEADAWRASSRWTSAEQMADVYGDLQFELKPGFRTSLEHYIKYALDNKADFPFYCTTFGKFRGQESLLDDFAVPSWFHEDVYDWLDMDGSFKYFICGGQRTGSNIHVDRLGTCAWNALACGHKHWVLFPPGDAVEYLRKLGVDDRGSQRPPAYWFLDVLPRLREAGQDLGMVECIQRPGETIFVPAGWWHAVLNLDFTVAITMNHMLPMMLPRALAMFDRESPMFARMMRMELKKLSPDKRKLIPDSDGDAVEANS